MHPNPAFRDETGDAIDRAVGIGIAHLFAATPEGPMVVHAPLTRSATGVRFHIARANRIADHLDGAAVVASVAGVSGYVSPNWYASPLNQVPTWNYVAVELEGPVVKVDEAALIAQLDALAAAHEPRVMPDRPWHRDKMDDALFRRMLRGIVGFELTVTAVRTTTKLSQNKFAIDRAGVIAGLRVSGNDALAAAMA